MEKAIHRALPIWVAEMNQNSNKILVNDHHLSTPSAFFHFILDKQGGYQR